jgi:hypothetical protein
MAGTIKSSWIGLPLIEDKLAAFTWKGVFSLFQDVYFKVL